MQVSCNIILPCLIIEYKATGITVFHNCDEQKVWCVISLKYKLNNHISCSPHVVSIATIAPTCGYISEEPHASYGVA